MANLKNTVISDTGFFKLPVGDTATRPASPTATQLRFNTDTGQLEQFRPGLGAWIAPSNTGVIATGGDSVYDVDTEGTTYRVHVFTATGTSTFSVLQGGEVEYLIVAGGGGGGGGIGGDYWGTGGGGGEVIQSLQSVNPNNFNINVGDGGVSSTSSSSSGDTGESSSAFGVTANPGTGGGGAGGVGGTSGSGNSGGSGTSTSSPDRGGGGGGGQAQPGGNGGSKGGDGGNGVVSFIPGTAVFYGGGGGGFNGDTDEPGQGGLGGGATPTDRNNDENLSGVPNTGGGAGERDGKAGSGIVIIRYPLRQNNPETSAGQDVRNGLVLDLDFAKPTVYSGSGSVVSDSRLTGLEGSINGPSFVNPRTHRSSFSFDGVNDYITLGNTVILNSGLTSSSFSSWWKYLGQGSGTDERAFILESDSFHFSHFVDTDGTLRTHINTTENSNQFIPGFSPTVGEWYYSFVVWDGSNLILYVNGIEVGRRSQGGTSLIVQNLRIGTYRSNDNRWWLGDIASVSIYNRAVTATEVAQSFNATRWRFGV